MLYFKPFFVKIKEIMKNENIKIIAENKKAYFDYEILKKYLAGISLLGPEVKSIKNYGVNLKGSFAIIKQGEAFLIGLEIPPYQPGNVYFHYNPKRTRKLLLHKREIEEIFGKLSQKGLTLVPLKVLVKNGIIKVEIGLVKPKKKFEKKEKIKEREIEKEIQREMARIKQSEL